MENYPIRTHNFSQAKSEIRSMAQNAPRSSQFSLVPTEGTGLSGWLLGTKHNVTGEEVNKLIREIQKNFTAVHKSTLQIYSTLSSVYNAFESLDKDYINYILQNLKATSEAANAAAQTADALTTTIKRVKENLTECRQETNMVKNDVTQHINMLEGKLATLDAKVQNTIDGMNGRIQDIQIKLNSAPRTGGGLNFANMISIAALSIAIIAFVLSLVK